MAVSSSPTSSPVAFPEDTKEAFTNLKIRRKARYIIFEFEDLNLNTTYISPRDAKAETMVAGLPATKAQYILFDHDTLSRDGRPRSRLFLFAWCPPSASIESKMLVSSQLRNVCQVFNGVEEHNVSSVAAVRDLLELDQSSDESDWDPDDD